MLHLIRWDFNAHLKSWWIIVLKGDECPAGAGDGWMLRAPFTDRPQLFEAFIFFIQST